MTNSNRHTMPPHGHDHHEHGADCGCGCRDHGHSEAENIVNSAFRFSRRADILLATPVSARELEARICPQLLEAAGRIAVDGAVLGHIKANIRLRACTVNLSVTRVGVIDKTYIGSWAAAELISGYSLTVNILSVGGPDVDLSDIIHKLF